MYWDKCDNQPETVKIPFKDFSKYISINSFILFTFCLLLHNFFPDCPTAVVQTLKESWCYGDSCDVHNHVITAKRNKTVD